MKHTAITFKASADVAFTMEEIDLMIRASQMHYDSVCKQASVDDGGSRIGLLIRTRNYCRNTEGEPRSFTFRELDTLTKICEMTYAFKGEEAAQLSDIGHAIGNVLRALNAAAVEPITITP